MVSARPEPEAAPQGGVGRWQTPRAARQAQAPLPPLRRLLHALLVLAGWVLFVWSWQRVTADRPELGELRWLMLGALLVVPLVTLGWVAHNLGIHRRKGPRRSVPQVQARYESDFNGRRIEADWAALAAARRVDIVVDGGRKQFVEIVRPPVPAAPAAKELT